MHVLKTYSSQGQKPQTPHIKNGTTKGNRYEKKNEVFIE